MSSGGRGSVGFCGTTKNHIDSSASYTADCSGVSRRGQTLPRCHARVPIPMRMTYRIGSQKESLLDGPRRRFGRAQRDRARPEGTCPKKEARKTRAPSITSYKVFQALPLLQLIPQPSWLLAATGPRVIGVLRIAIVIGRSVSLLLWRKFICRETEQCDLLLELLERLATLRNQRTDLSVQCGQLFDRKVFVLLHFQFSIQAISSCPLCGDFQVKAVATAWADGRGCAARSVLVLKCAIWTRREAQ